MIRKIMWSEPSDWEPWILCRRSGANWKWYIFLGNRGNTEAVSCNNGSSACALVLLISVVPYAGNNSYVTSVVSINLTIQHSELVAVVGQVGCGKSSLISAMLGELKKLEGRVNLQASIASSSRWVTLLLWQLLIAKLTLWKIVFGTWVS